MRVKFDSVFNFGTLISLVNSDLSDNPGLCGEVFVDTNLTSLFTVGSWYLLLPSIQNPNPNT